MPDAGGGGTQGGPCGATEDCGGGELRHRPGRHAGGSSRQAWRSGHAQDFILREMGNS